MSEKAVVYVRLSREDEDKMDKYKESKSIENQIKTLDDFAKTQNFNVVNIYSDDGYSGENFDRPAFKRMMEDMQTGKFDVLLLKDLSRLGRSLYRVGNFIENICPQYGIRVISVSDHYDSLSYKDDMSIVLRSFLNDYYLKEFKRKCKKSREYAARTKHLNYYPKYGYCFDEKGREHLDDYSANIVRRVFTDIAEQSFSCGAVANLLNREGILTRSAYATQVLGLKALHRQSAEKWNAEQVWSIVTDYEYCGHSVNWVRHKKDERILIKNTHEAIISEELYALAQAEIEKHSKVKQRLEHIGSCLIDKRLKKNLLFSKKQQIYFLRENNKKLYAISRDMMESVVFLEVVSMIEAWGNNYIKRQREINERTSKHILADLHGQYLRLLDLRFENKIDELSFIKQQKSLVEKIRNIEESVQEEKFDKLRSLILRLKRIKKRKIQVIKTVVKVCYVLKTETKNTLLNIVFG